MDACIRKDIWRVGYGSVIFAAMHMRKWSGGSLGGNDPK